MRIAFVGKGGSGKSTLAAFFVHYLMKQRLPLLAIDADINIHLADLLGVSYKSEDALSSEPRATMIREYLKGKNERIKTLGEFVKTTPPANGSNFVSIRNDNFFIKSFTIPFGENAHYAHVGTYEAKDVGATCYHGNLAVFENILSHSRIGKDEWLVADMVAGVDAFANSLHAQFDAIVLVVEPTPEGVGVFRQYESLAGEAQVWNRVIVMGNKVEDVGDKAYLKKQVGDKLIGTFKRNIQIKKDRQLGKPIFLERLIPQEFGVLVTLADWARAHYVAPNRHLKKMVELHAKFNKQNWAMASYGDLSHQIDPDFSI